MPGPKSTKISKTTQPKNKRYTYLMAAGVLLVLVFMYDLSIGGNIRFYTEWASCGNKPVQLTGSIGNPIISYEESSAVSLVRGAPTYFCTPFEAEQAGYSASPDYYNFPHLNRY